MLANNKTEVIIIGSINKCSIVPRQKKVVSIKERNPRSTSNRKTDVACGRAAFVLLADKFYPIINSGKSYHSRSRSVS